MKTVVDVPSPLPNPLVGKPASKVVKFSCEDGVWKADIKVHDPTRPFTERDFNQLSILLNVRRAAIRREAAIAYQVALRKKASNG